MNTVTSKDGTTIAYEKIGEGPALILVDGALSYRAFGPSRPLAALLAEDFTVYTYDRRGRGDSSDTAPYSATREIEDLDALIEQAGRAFVYGGCSGAVLALRAAAYLGAEKIKKLALYEPPFSTDHTQPICGDRDSTIGELTSVDTHADMLAGFLSGMRSARVLAGLKESPKWPAMKAVAHTLAYENAVIDDDELPIDVARKVTLPTLIMAGAASMDFVHAATQMLHQVMSHSHYHLLEGQSHDVSAEAMAPLLRSFFLLDADRTYNNTQNTPQRSEGHVQVYEGIQRIFG
jgi:pimeloyl-ACP methyl ester carboxylesterase